MATPRQDRRFLAALLRQPQEFDKVSQGIQPIDLVGAAPGDKDASAIYTAALALRREGKPANATAVLNFLDEPDPTGERTAETSEQRQHRAEFLSVTSTAKPDLTAEAERIKARGAHRNELTVWASIAMILQNLGAFFGMYMFSHLASASAAAGHSRFASWERSLAPPSRSAVERDDNHDRRPANLRRRLLADPADGFLAAFDLRRICRLFP